MATKETKVTQTLYWVRPDDGPIDPDHVDRVITRAAESNGFNPASTIDVGDDWHIIFTGLPGFYLSQRYDTEGMLIGNYQGVLVKYNPDMQPGVMQYGQTRVVASSSKMKEIDTADKDCVFRAEADVHADAPTFRQRMALARTQALLRHHRPS